jgi:hypothetical protein
MTGTDFLVATAASSLRGGLAITDFGVAARKDLQRFWGDALRTAGQRPPEGDYAELLAWCEREAGERS